MGGARIAAGMAMAWGLLLIGFGELLLVTFPPLVRATEGGYCENIDHPGPCTSLPEMLAPGVVVMVGGMLSIVPSIGLFERRTWSRGATMLAYSLWSLAAFAGAFANATGDSNVAGTLLCFAMTTYFVTIVTLLSRQ